MQVSACHVCPSLRTVVGHVYRLRISTLSKRVSNESSWYSFLPVCVGTFIISRNELKYCAHLYVNNVLYVYNCTHEKAIKPSCILYLVPWYVFCSTYIKTNVECHMKMAWVNTLFLQLNNSRNMISEW